MIKRHLLFCTLCLTFGAFGCKKKIKTSTISEITSSDKANDASPGNPTPPTLHPPEIPETTPPPAPDPISPFVCGGGDSDGTRFYVLKADGSKDYDAYKHTPKTKQELIDLIG